jgi:hypothetical protein
MRFFHVRFKIYQLINLHFSKIFNDFLFFLGMAFSGTVFSIAFFNFAGISVTKEMSATTRMVLDSVRTLVIWGVSLAIGWQPFQALQLLGFAVLVTGMCVYNDIVIGKIILFFVCFIFRMHKGI